MCLILFAYRVHPRYELLLVANRDEFYARPTAPLAFWDTAPDVLAGRDLLAGGTWLGITRGGRFAAVTNYRDPASVKPDSPSRGALVSEYLCGADKPPDYLDRLASRGRDYNGFNLLIGEGGELFYYSNQGEPPQALAPGLYGLSNHLLNTPWPKVEKGKRGLATLLTNGATPTAEVLLRLLENPEQAADEELPHTGVTLAWERILSALFIASPAYGTRSSSLLWVTASGDVRFLEKTWSDGKVREFQLQWPPLAAADGHCINPEPGVIDGRH